MADIEREPNETVRPSITVGGEIIEVTPENTRCVKHAIGKVAIGDIVRNSSDFDHIRIFLRHENSRGGLMAIEAYLFRGAVGDMLFDYEGFGAAIELLEEAGIPVEVNAPSVSNVAINKFFSHIESSQLTASDSIDDDLNNLIDNYRADDDNNSTN